MSCGNEENSAEEIDRKYSEDLNFPNCFAIHAMMTFSDDQNKTREQLLQEIASLRSRLDAEEREFSGGEDVRQALRESRMDFRLAAEAAKIGVYKRNLRTGEDLWSPEFLEIYGYGPDEPLPLRDGIPASVHPDDRRQVIEEFRARVDRTADPQFSSVHRIIRPDGQIRWVMIRGRLEFDSHHRPIKSHGIVLDITDQKRAEEELRESKERFRRALSIQTVGILFFNLRGRILDANTTFEKMSGYTVEELQNLDWKVLTPSEYREITARTAQNLAERGETPPYEKQHIRKDGSRWHGLFSPMRLAGRGLDTECIEFIIDITQRKRAEKALRESEEKFRTVFEQAAVGMGRVSFTDARWIEVNDTFCRMLGYTREEFLNTPWPRITHPEDVELDLIPFRRMAAGELDSYTVEKRFIHKQGHPIWARLTLSLVRDAAGSPHYEIAIIENITRQKEVETALKRSQARWSAAIENFDEGAIIATETEQLIYWNPAARAMHGLTNEDQGTGPLENLSAIFELWLPDGSRQLELDEWPMRRIRRGEKVWRIELCLRRPDQDWEKMLSYSGAMVETESGERVIFLSAHDLTDQRNAEKALRRLNENLEQRVAERTALAEARSRQLQTLAVELIEAEEKERRRFARLLHDDLQQLLAAAKMQLQAVRESLPSDPTLPYVEQLLKESIDKSRRLSHELSPSVLQHADFTTSLLWLFKQMKQQFGLEVQFMSQAAQTIVSAPLRRFLFRAVQELLFNIIKHAGVKCAVVGLSQTDHRLNITVSDKGSGFDPRIMEESHLSAGLGLQSMRERAGYFGGHLGIESGLGRGSRFTLHVPLDTAQDIEQGPPDGEMAADGNRQAAEPDTRILLADDHMVMRQGLKRIIGSQPGIQVVGEASNGREALDMSRQLKPDIVVMDITMPEMDGIEATRRIKAEFPDVKVVGLTMHDEEFLLQAMIQAGAEANVSKAASSAALLEAIYAIQVQTRR